MNAKLESADDPSAGSPTETLLRLLLPPSGDVHCTPKDMFRKVEQINLRIVHRIVQSVGDGQCVQRAGTESARVDDSPLQGIPCFYLHHVVYCRLPNLFRQGYTFVECFNGVGVQPRTSKGITDLPLPQTSLRWKHKAPPGSNQLRMIFDTLYQAMVSFVTG